MSLLRYIILLKSGYPTLDRRQKIRGYVFLAFWKNAVICCGLDLHLSG